MSFLAIDDEDLIIPPKTYIIRDVKEMSDFIDFYHALAKYNDPLSEKRTPKEEYRWDTELVVDRYETRLSKKKDISQCSQ